MRTTQQKIDDLYNELLELCKKESFLLSRRRILNFTATMFKQWASGVKCVANECIGYNGVKYFCIKATNAAQSLILPDSTAAIDIYKPYTDESPREWIYNEYVENGFVRIDNGLAYELYGVANPDLFTNRTKPSELLTNWKLT
jgi:hypothetical protein